MQRSVVFEPPRNRVYHSLAIVSGRYVALGDVRDGRTRTAGLQSLSKGLVGLEVLVAVSLLEGMRAVADHVRKQADSVAPPLTRPLFCVFEEALTIPRDRKCSSTTMPLISACASVSTE